MIDCRTPHGKELGQEWFRRSVRQCVGFRVGVILLVMLSSRFAQGRAEYGCMVDNVTGTAGGGEALRRCGK